jgi:hypothetical protein
LDSRFPRPQTTPVATPATKTCRRFPGIEIWASRFGPPIFELDFHSPETKAVAECEIGIECRVLYGFCRVLTCREAVRL